MKNANQIKFNPSGKLIIMQVSDPQDMKYVRPAMVKMLNNAYDAVKPDLVLFTGDNILGNHLLDARIGNRQIASGKEATLKVMRESIDNIAAPLQRRGIPFAMIYGNHDDRNLVSKDEQADIFRSYSCCLPMNTDDPTVDCDTYNIPVLDSEGKKQIFNIWMLDCAWYDKAQDKCYERIKPETVEWFRRTSSALTAENGGSPIPSLMFLHIPLPETLELFEKCPTGEGAVFKSHDGSYYRFKPGFGSGSLGELPAVLEDGAGLFDAALECGGVKAIVTGHDHVNCFEGSYKGIDFVQTACASFRCYGNELRGVRVFEINEVDPSDYLTYSLTYSDLCGRGIGSKLRYIWDADGSGKEKAALIAGAAAGAAALTASAIKAVGKFRK